MIALPGLAWWLGLRFAGAFFIWLGAGLLPAGGSGLLPAGLWALGSGLWALGSGCWALGAGLVLAGVSGCARPHNNLSCVLRAQRASVKRGLKEEEYIVSGR